MDDRDVPDATPSAARSAPPGLRHRVRRHPVGRVVYRSVVGVLGVGVVVLGLLLIPLPGPGWLIVFGGLALLATEFPWAERLLGFARRHVSSWTSWIAGRSTRVRALIGVAGLAVVAGAIWLYDVVIGLPGWVPLL